jgi:hypothetical protein
MPKLSELSVTKFFFFKKKLAILGLSAKTFLKFFNTWNHVLNQLFSLKFFWVRPEQNFGILEVFANVLFARNLENLLYNNHSWKMEKKLMLFLSSFMFGFVL